MIKQLVNKYKSSEFIRNFLTLFSGSTISQFIPILISPIISRLFTPEDFGRLAIFMAISTFVGGFMTGAYDTAIMLPKKKSNAINLLALSLILSVAFCILVGITILFAGEFISKSAGDITIAKYLYLAPIIVLSLGIFRTLNIWFTRYKKYKLLAGTRIAQTVTGSGTKLGTGFASLGVSGLIAGEIGRNIIGSMILFYRFIKREKQNIKLISKKEIILNAKRYIDFPKFSAPQGILDMVNNNGFIFIFSSFFGVGVLGLYNFGVGKVLKPLSLIGPSLSQVFFEKASKLKRENKEVWPLAKKIIILLTLLNIPIFLIVLLWGPNIFAFVFSAKWRVAGVFAQIVMPWYVIRFISSSISTIPIIYEKQKQFFRWGLIMNIGTPGLFLIAGVLDFPIKYSLFILSVASCLFYLLLILWFRKISKANYNKI